MKKLTFMVLFLSAKLLLANDRGLSTDDVVQLLLADKPLTTQQQCAFAELEYKAPGEIKKKISLAKLKGDEAHYKQVSMVYNKLYTKSDRDLDTSFMGLTLGWYFIMVGDNASTLPLIIDVAPDSAASKAGLFPGDVIKNVGAFEMQGVETRNQLVEFLNKWPISVPLELGVSRSKSKDPLSSMDKKVFEKIQLYSNKVTFETSNE